MSPVGNRGFGGYKGVMADLAHELVHPINATRRSPLTPLVIVAVLLASLVLSAPAPAADRNVSAAAAQYPLASQQSVSPETGATVPLGEEVDPPEATPTEETPVPEQVVLPATADQPAGGRAAREFRLPFTGHVVLPLLIAGAMFLTAGVTLRRRVSGQPA